LANQKHLWAPMALVLAVLGLVGFLFIDTAREKEIVFEADRLVIPGVFGATVSRDQVESVTLVERIPKVLYRTNGASVGHIRLGLFKLEGVEKAHLTVMDKDNPPFILVAYKNRPHYINFGEREKTLQVYEEIRAWARGK